MTKKSESRRLREALAKVDAAAPPSGVPKTEAEWNRAQDAAADLAYVIYGEGPEARLMAELLRSPAGRVILGFGFGGEK